MNPVTAMLLDKINRPELEAWIGDWGRLEQTFLAVYRSGLVSSEQRQEYRALRQALRRNYDSWRDELRDYWDSTRVAGEKLEADPFMTLTAPDELNIEQVNWRSVQILPAAREALNSYLLDLIERGQETS